VWTRVGGCPVVVDNLDFVSDYKRLESRCWAIPCLLRRGTTLTSPSLLLLNGKDRSIYGSIQRTIGNFDERQIADVPYPL
jgi:hypothetical protein